MTYYTDKDLRAEAIDAVRTAARRVHLRARYVGYTLHLSEPGVDGKVSVVLQARGTVKRGDGATEDIAVNIAI